MNGDDSKQTLEQLLLRAEKRYGKRAHGVEFDVSEKTDGPIAVEFHDRELTTATVHIQTCSEEDKNQRRFQLALEGFHLLSAVPRHEVTFLEEGLSEIFALTETVGLTPSDDKEYKKAHELCTKLMAECGDDIIRRLRENQPYLSRITPAQIIDLCPEFPKSSAKSLCKRWPYYQ
jgi:hypothetical protein